MMISNILGVIGIANLVVGMVLALLALVVGACPSGVLMRMVTSEHRFAAFAPGPQTIVHCGIIVLFLAIVENAGVQCISTVRSVTSQETQVSAASKTLTVSVSYVLDQNAKKLARFWITPWLMGYQVLARESSCCVLGP